MLKISQAPDFSTLPTAGGGAPEGGAPASTFNIIYSPLDSLGKILADLDFKAFLENHFGSDSEDLARKIWIMYGGSEDDLKPGKKGLRKDKPTSADTNQQSQSQQEEYNSTRNTRWKRLPMGVSIDEITDLESINKAIIGGWATLAKESAKPASASVIALIKIANSADSNCQYKIADKIDYLCSLI